MANRFTFPRATALDSNGAPLSGAQLHFYEAGTTKPANVYTDAALTVPAANPVVADSAGRFGDIFLQAIDYKVILTDAGAATVWTADPVSGTLDARGDDFAPAQQSPADMTVLVGAGALFDAVSRTLVVRPAQSTPLVAAPVANPRHDIVHVDRKTGAVGVATGGEAPAPADPPIPAGVLPVARVRLETTTVEITAAEIDDIRELGLLGAGSAATRDTGTANGQVPVMDSVGYPPANGSQIFNLHMPRGYIDGLILANDALDPANDIDIGPGIARDDANAANLELASTLVKRLDAAWAEGTAQGGLDAGAKAASTWYHVWLIRRPDTGTVDALFSTSATVPVMPPNYDQKRRVGAVRTDGAGNIVGFRQHGEWFMWGVPAGDYNLSAMGTAALIQTLTVPPLDGVIAVHTVHYRIGGAGNVGCLVTTISQPDTAPSAGAFHIFLSSSGDGDSATVRVPVDSSGQIRVRVGYGAGAGETLRGVTHGWIDCRGRDG